MALNITQKDIKVVRDNEVDALGNKIKLKSASLANLINHRVIVPFENIKEPVVNVSEPVVAENNKSFNLIPNDFNQMVSGGERPINVKEKMIDNMSEKYDRVISVIPGSVFPSQPEPQNEPVIENTPDININDIAVANEAAEKDDVETPTVDYDINKMYQEVNNTREKLLSIREEVANAESDADKSEQKVQELGVQFTETEKSLQEAEEQKQAIQKKIIYELRNQLSTMNAEEQKYNEAIANANQRREESQNKIIDFESRIDDTKQRITAVNDDIARAEEKYNMLVGINNDQANEMEEPVIRKVA